MAKTKARRCCGCEKPLEPERIHFCQNRDCANDNVFCHVCEDRLRNDRHRCGTCAGEKEIRCAKCKAKFLASKLTKCAFGDCKTLCCAACAQTAFTKYGFCADCRKFTCNGCGKKFERGTETFCANGRDCKSSADYDLCSGCVPNLLNDETKLCPKCGDEKTVRCLRCGHRARETKALLCANFKQCGTGWCGACAAYANGKTKCEECSKVKCSSCAKVVDAEEAVECACRNESVCKNCADEAFQDGHCVACAPKNELVQCGICLQRKFFKQIVGRCSACKKDVCNACKTRGKLNDCPECRQCVCIGCSQYCGRAEHSGSARHFCKTHQFPEKGICPACYAAMGKLRRLGHSIAKLFGG